MHGSARKLVLPAWRAQTDLAMALRGLPAAEKPEILEIQKCPATEMSSFLGSPPRPHRSPQAHPCALCLCHLLPSPGRFSCAWRSSPGPRSPARCREAFFTAVMQNFARSHKYAIDRVGLDVEVLDNRKARTAGLRGGQLWRDSPFRVGQRVWTAARSRQKSLASQGSGLDRHRKQKKRHTLTPQIGSMAAHGASATDVPPNPSSGRRIRATFLATPPLASGPFLRPPS